MTNGNPRRTKFPANFVGPQIRKLRIKQGWSQAKLAERLQLNGLDIGREGVAQVEAQAHCVKDKDLFLFAHALKVNLPELFSQGWPTLNHFQCHVNSTGRIIKTTPQKL
jgi:transcriptional regulator with XRE-family HTH domain